MFDPATSTLHFVDIEENKVSSSYLVAHLPLKALHFKVFHLDTITMDLSEEVFPEKITCLALRKCRAGVRLLPPPMAVTLA